MKTIKIIDNGQDRYTIQADSYILGRRYDNNAEQIKIIKPEIEQDSICVMIVTRNNQVIDHIIIENEYININNNLTQYESVNIGFSFSKDNGYVKNSEVRMFNTLPAQKPDDFIPVEPEQKQSIEILSKYGFVSAELDNNMLVFKNALGNVASSVQLSGFIQEQSDWNETNDKSETYIKNKPTKLSQFENDNKFVANSQIVSRETLPTPTADTPDFVQDTDGLKYKKKDGDTYSYENVGGGSGNYVTLDTEQTITADKSTTASISFKDTSNNDLILQHKNNGLQISRKIAKTGNTTDILQISGDTTNGCTFVTRLNKFQINVGNIANGAYKFNQRDFSPAVDNNRDLGTSTTRYKDLYLSGNLSDGTNSTSISNILTLDTEQTITGTKTIEVPFNNEGVNVGLKFNLNGTSGIVPNLMEFYYNDTRQGFVSMQNNDIILSGPFTFGYGNANMHLTISQLLPGPRTGSYITPLDLGSVSRQWKDLYLSGNLSDGTNSISIAEIVNNIGGVSTVLGDTEDLGE